MLTQTPWYVHNINPIAITIGSEAIPWYWLNYLLGYIWCWFGLEYLAKKQSGRLRPEDITAFTTWGWLGMLIGARLIYISLYNWTWFQEHPDQMIAIWNGGMSFHGGLLGIALTCWVIAICRRVSLLAFTDLLVVLIPWPLATGRICNFINGELPGRPSAVPWAVMFPEPWNDFPRHPSQLYEALSEGVLLGLLMLWAWPRWRQHVGALTALFLAGYGCLRFFTEFTREPDPQVGYFLSGLTMGQLLCLLMVAAAACLVGSLAKHKDHH